MKKSYNIDDLEDVISLAIEIIKMYSEEKKSLQEISIIKQIPVATVDKILIDNNILKRKKNNRL